MLKFECCFRRHTLLLVSNYIRSKTVLTSMNVIVNSSCKKQKDCTKTLYYIWSVRRTSLFSIFRYSNEITNRLFEKNFYLQKHVPKYIQNVIISYDNLNALGENN